MSLHNLELFTHFNRQSYKGRLSFLGIDSTGDLLGSVCAPMFYTEMPMFHRF